MTIAKVPIGTRVWAEAQVPDSSNPTGFRTVAYGFGTYIGDFAYTGDSAFGHPYGKNNVPNPKIQLDRGGFVYGCECWWYQLDAYQESMAEVPDDLEYLEAPHND